MRTFSPFTFWEGQTIWNLTEIFFCNSARVKLFLGKTIATACAKMFSQSSAHHRESPGRARAVARLDGSICAWKTPNAFSCSKAARTYTRNRFACLVLQVFPVFHACVPENACQNHCRLVCKYILPIFLHHL